MKTQHLTIKTFFSMTILIVALTTVFSLNSLAATFIVDDDGFANAANCDDAVTPASTTIQGAIDLAGTTGDTVQVCPGTYDEDIALNKDNLILRGVDTNTTIIRGIPGGDTSTIHVLANNTTIAGFTITRLGNNVAQWNDPTLNSAGIVIQGQAITGTLIRDNYITGNRTGIDVNNSNGNTIRNNNIDFNRTGLIFRNQTDNTTMVENFITNNWTVGVLFLDASGGSNVPVQSALNSNFTNNSISNNWYAEVVDRQSGGSLPAPGTTNLKNFTRNWWGNVPPTVTTANSAEPGYAAQIPTQYGGSATPPPTQGQPDIAGPASANIQYQPYLTSGQDTDVETTAGRGTYGFQGIAATLVVDDDLQCPNVAFTTIQSAVNAAIAGETIQVCAGTYNETQILINKSLSVIGAGANVTTINGGNATLPTAGLIHIETPDGDDGDVTFSGFTVTNPGTGGGTRTAFFVKPLDVDTMVTITNNRILGVSASDNGIYSYRPRGPVVVSNNEFTNNGGNPILFEQMLNTSTVDNNTISGNTSTAYFNMTYDGENISNLQKVSNNRITASTASAISFNSGFTGTTAGNFTNIQITGNAISRLGSGRTAITLNNAANAANAVASAINGAAISGNTISGADIATSNGIRLRGAITNTIITCNSIGDVDRSFFGEVVSGLSATGTEVHNNNFVSNVTGFVWNGTNPINAENNWWNSPSGPTIASNPNGTGDPIVDPSGTVDYNPFLTAVSSCGPTLAANLDISIVVTPDPVAPGGNLTYQITLTNNGNISAQNIVLNQQDYFTKRGGTRLVVTSIVAPAGFTCQAGATFGGSPFAEVTCQGGNLTAGQTVQFTITKRQRTPLPRGMVIINEATVRMGTVTPNQEVKSATDTTTVQ